VNGIDVYFDFVSPYAYLAWMRAPRVLAGVELTPRPVLLGVLLEHFGQLGPAEIPAKRVLAIRDTMRRAADAGLPLLWPERHPFKSMLPERVVLAAEERLRAAVASAIFMAAWGRGEDIEQRDVVHAAIRDVAGGEAGADALIARATEKEISNELRRANEEAIARGVFGVPTFDVHGELFWGDDQLERVARVLAGEDSLDRELAARIEARPNALTRRRAPVVP